MTAGRLAGEMLRGSGFSRDPTLFAIKPREGWGTHGSCDCLLLLEELEDGLGLLVGLLEGGDAGLLEDAVLGVVGDDGADVGGGDAGGGGGEVLALFGVDGGLGLKLLDGGAEMAALGGDAGDGGGDEGESGLRGN